MNMKKYHLLLLLVFPLFLTSCFKDELPNTECDVLDVWIDGDQYKECFYQPETDMRFNKISSTENHIVFTVRSMLSLPEMPISFNLTPGATIQPANGSLQNFKEHPVVYTVTSEDGAWHREYIVEFREPDLPKLHYDFEDVELKKEKAFTLRTAYRGRESEGDGRQILVQGVIDCCFEEDGHVVDRKLNVAITRAREQMIITGNPHILSANPLFKALIEEYEKE